MNKEGHSLGAIVISSVSIYICDFDFSQGKEFIEASLMFSGIIVGSFLPDLDADYSYFNSKVPIIPELYKGIKYLSKKTKFHAFFKHRGVMLHSIWTIALMLIINLILILKINSLNNDSIFKQINIIYFTNGLILGTFGHHFLDMVTRTGLQYFYPSKLKITKYTFLKPIKFFKNR
jgi:membrane-bound metal-dependent hydrolase YbcI (DUF457 family)